MSKAKTKEEVREEFLRKIKAIANYWATVNLSGPGMTDTIAERCDGVAFSILNIFDGTSVDLPAMDIALAPHEDDKEYYIEHEEDWYEPGMIINDDVHLHHEYCDLDKK